jgi:hypothetical protein
VKPVLSLHRQDTGLPRSRCKAHLLQNVSLCALLSLCLLNEAS